MRQRDRKREREREREKVVETESMDWKTRGEERKRGKKWWKLKAWTGKREEKMPDKQTTLCYRPTDAVTDGE